jgi:hypothetical protein
LVAKLREMTEKTSQITKEDDLKEDDSIKNLTGNKRHSSFFVSSSSCMTSRSPLPFSTSLFSPYIILITRDESHVLIIFSKGTLLFSKEES